MNNSNYFNLEAIENAFKLSKERGNYFIEFNKSVVLSATKEGKLLETLNEISDVINSGSPLSADQYTLLGSIAYFYGMDFTGQSYLHENICKYVAERFTKLFDGYDFSDKEIACIYTIFSNIKEKNIVEPKDALKDAILENISLNADDMNTLKTVIHPGLKAIVNASIIPVNLAKEFADLKLNKDLTYQNLSKYNLFITQNIEMNGKAIKNYCTVYSDSLYNKLLNECLLREEKAKFGLMYFDSIFSLSEAITRLKITEAQFVMLTINIDEFCDLTDFNAEKERFEIDMKELEANLTNKEELQKEAQYVPKISQEELNECFMRRPELTMAAYIEEIAKNNSLTEDDIIGVVDKLLSPESGELMQHIYQYMTQHINSAIDTEDFYPLIDKQKLFERFQAEIEKAQNEYRAIAEEICKPIDENKINRVTQYVNDIIGCLILVDAQQKQYLISQFASNGISTYNHLQEIVSLIEHAKIFGADASAYATLFNYLSENDEFTEIFAKGEELTHLENRISILDKFKQWFSRGMNTGVEEISENDEAPKPKMEILK